MTDEDEPYELTEEELWREHEATRQAEKETALAAVAEKARAGLGKRECQVCENGNAHGAHGPPTWSMTAFDHTHRGQNTHELNHWTNSRGPRIKPNSGLGWQIPLPEHEDATHHHDERGFFSTQGHPPPKVGSGPHNNIPNLPIDMETTQRLINYIIDTNHPDNIFHDSAYDEKGNNIRGFHDHELNVLLGIGHPTEGRAWGGPMEAPLPAGATRVVENPPITEAHTKGWGENAEHAYERYGQMQYDDDDVPIGYSSPNYPNIGQWLNWQYLNGPWALLDHAKSRAEKYSKHGVNGGPHEGLGDFVLNGGRHGKTPCQLCLGHGTITGRRALWWMSHFDNYAAMKPTDDPQLDHTGEPMFHEVQGEIIPGQFDADGNKMRKQPLRIPITRKDAIIDEHHPEYEDTVDWANDFLSDHSELFGEDGWVTNNPLQEMIANKGGEFLCPSCSGKGVCVYCDGDGEVQASPPSMDTEMADKHNYLYAAFKHAHDLMATSPMMPWMRPGESKTGVIPSFFRTERDPMSEQWKIRPQVELSDEQRAAIQEAMAHQQDLTRFSQGLTAENRAALQSMFPDFKSQVGVVGSSVPRSFWEKKRRESRQLAAVRGAESRKRMAQEAAERKANRIAPEPADGDDYDGEKWQGEPDYDEKGNLIGFKPIDEVAPEPTGQVGVAATPAQEVGVVAPEPTQSAPPEGMDASDARMFTLMNNKTPFEANPGFYRYMDRAGHIPKHWKEATPGGRFGTGISHGKDFSALQAFQEGSQERFNERWAKKELDWNNGAKEREDKRKLFARDKKWLDSDEGRAMMGANSEFYDEDGKLVKPPTEAESRKQFDQAMKEDQAKLDSEFEREMIARHKKQWQDMRAKIYESPNAVWEARDVPSLRYALTHRKLDGSIKQNGSHVDNGDLLQLHNESGADLSDDAIYSSGAAEMALFRLIHSIHPDWVPDEHEDMAGFPGQFMNPPDWDAHTYADVVASLSARNAKKHQEYLDKVEAAKKKDDSEVAPEPTDDDVRTSNVALLRDALALLKFYDALASTRERVGVVDTIASVSSLNLATSAHPNRIAVRR